eukprot:jgi/Tetstr1/453563/TSEL_040531.t1
MENSSVACTSLPLAESPSLDRLAAAILLGTHRRVGRDSPLNGLDAPVLEKILSEVEIVVPDVVDTLAEAIRQARHGQRILLRTGEYLCGALERNAGYVGQKAADTVLRISKSVRIRGEPGTIIKGMLILEEGSAGSITGVKLVDGGDCCISSAGATWQIESCHLQCGHAAAVDLRDGSNFTLRDCRLGGEEPSSSAVWYHEAYGSVQEFGMSKRACYGLRLRGDAAISVDNCQLSHCSEAAVFLADRACVALSDCLLKENSCSFISGYGGGESLQARRCLVTSTKMLWADDDRPTTCSFTERME